MEHRIVEFELKLCINKIKFCQWFDLQESIQLGWG